MRGRVLHRAPPLIVNLRRRDVFMVKEVLHGFDGFPCVEEERGKLLAMGRAAGAEEGTALDTGRSGIFRDGGGEVNALRLVAIALQMETQRRLIAVLVEIRYI